MKQNKSPKVVLLTGASSGIGLQTALRIASQGHVVYGAARRTDLISRLAHPNIHAVSLDLTDEQQIQAAVDQVINEAGRIDVLVNNAGYGSFGPVECVSMDEARRQLEVNLFGLAGITRCVLPHMRQQGQGLVVNISSVAGRMTTYMGAWYHVSKYAVEALSDALRMELRQFNIGVSIVEPGVIRTDWGPIAADHLEQSTARTPYEAEGRHVTRLIRRLYSGPMPSSPDVIARAISRAVNARRPRTRYHAGFGSPSVILLHTLLPTRLFDRLIRRIM